MPRGRPFFISHKYPITDKMDHTPELTPMEFVPLTLEQQADAWKELREHVRQNSDVLSAAGLGARLGWNRQAASALLNPSENAVRTATTLERLAQAQHLLAGFGFLTLNPAYLVPVMGVRSSQRARELELQIRKLEAEYLRFAPDQAQARAIAAQFPAVAELQERAQEVGQHLQSLLNDLALCRRLFTELPLGEEAAV